MVLTRMGETLKPDQLEERRENKSNNCQTVGSMSVRGGGFKRRLRWMAKRENKESSTTKRKETRLCWTRDQDVKLGFYLQMINTLKDIKQLTHVNSDGERITLAVVIYKKTFFYNKSILFFIMCTQLRGIHARVDHQSGWNREKWIRQLSPISFFLAVLRESGERRGEGHFQQPNRISALRWGMATQCQSRVPNMEHVPRVLFAQVVLTAPRCC